MADKEFTLAELAKFDGVDGKPAFVAYQGKVYDVTASTMWEDGDHLGAHQAGADLTEAMAESPHEDNVMDDFPQVGILKQD